MTYLKLSNVSEPPTIGRFGSELAFDYVLGNNAALSFVRSILLSSDSRAKVKLNHKPCNQLMVDSYSFVLKRLGYTAIAISAFMVMIDVIDTLFKIGVLIIRL